MTEDLRQEELALAHRGMIHTNLDQAERLEADAVSVRRTSEKDAAAALAAERLAAAYAAVAQAEEYRQMLQSAIAEEAKAETDRANAALAAEEAAAVARQAEFGAVTARLANDCSYSERRSLELQGGRGPVIGSALAGRSPYITDGPFGGAASAPGVQTRQRSVRNRY